MPKSKNHRTYPEAFGLLIKEAAIKRVEIACDTPKAAEKLRGYIYGYFGALKVATDEKDCDPDTRQLKHMSEKVKLTVEGSTLVAIPRDEDPMARQILDALNKAALAPSSTTGAVTGPSADLVRIAKDSDDS